ncbi:MAG: hypothetical protein PHU44_13650 [Syntrophales bacterium]|nr:hypothetical protein [Syntrophales bacterium]MDD5640160.1 hypothetical protein [Syntrophales bacterium]
MGAIVGWLFKTALGRIIGGAVVAALLSGLLYAGCQVRSCMRAKEELQEYHRADEIRKEDPKVDQRVEEHKREVEEFSTPGDLKRGFDKLRHYQADD